MVDISDNRKMIVLVSTILGIAVTILFFLNFLARPTTLNLIGLILIPGIFFLIAFIFRSGNYEIWENRLSWTIIVLIVIARPDSLTIFLIIFLLFELQKKQIEAKTNQSVQPAKSISSAK